MKQCKGEGQGSCYKCTQEGKWSRTWMCFLFNIENDEHIYCYECAKELEKKNKGE